MLRLGCTVLRFQDDFGAVVSYDGGDSSLSHARWRLRLQEETVRSGTDFKADTWRHLTK